MNAFQQLLLCPTCGSFAKLMTRAEAGLRCVPKAAVYVCSNYPSCDCYVGCHPGSEKPLGHLANFELRRMRMKAHKAFDWFWQSKQIARDEAYGLLAEHLKLKPEESHIGMLDAEQCQSVVEYFGKRPWKTPKR